MVKIAFDNQIFLEQRFGGISRYFCEMFDILKENRDAKSKIIAPLHFNKHLSDLRVNGNYYVPTTTNKLNINRFVTKYSNQISELRFNRFKPDILHKTFFYKPQKTQFKSVITVYDMIHEKYNQNLSFIESKKVSIFNADHIICISESTKIDLLKYYKINENKVSVVPFGVGKNFFNNHRINSINQRNAELVFIGRRNGYKNFELFIKAFAGSMKLKKNFKIIVFGGGEFNKLEKILINNLGIQNNVIKKEGNDKVLKNILSSAVAMVYPSKYEGFGLPILEAMALGSIVFTSRTSSMPEVGGKHAYYFDPDSVNSIQSTLEDGLILNPDFSEDFQRSGILWAQKFSWENCADKTLKIYESLA
jgi:glycosyltransferase involved in cell wall biosynthesis